jgi:hypothetical protein
MNKEPQARFAVLITKESVEEWTVYVSAESCEEANDVADDLHLDCSFPEFEIVHSEYTVDASPIDPRHAVEPTRVDENQGMVCAVCLKSVEWTGISADDPDNRSGKTIPGPWVHAR